jgi:uncharacterized SAM-binding protein YcdF (DUF218 family)
MANGVAMARPVWRMRIRHRILVLVPFLVLFVFTAATVHLFVWPQLPPTPPSVDAIVLLGGPGDREDTALALAVSHAAPVLVQSIWDPAARPDRCLGGLPDVTVVCFHPHPDTTRGEAEYFGRLAAKRHWRSMILVVTTDQAWRARLRFSRCFSGQIYVTPVGLPAQLWVRQIPYQWGATAKALTLERDC